MISESVDSSEWTGWRGRVMGWYLASPFRRLSEILFLGDGRSRVVAAAAAALKEGGTVLDVGAGSGYFSFAIARRVPETRFICLDLSREMLQRLRRVAQRKDMADRLQVLEGSAYHLDLADAAVDVAMANGVLHELADPRVAVQEMARVLRHGGLAIIADFRNTWVGQRIASAHRSQDHGPYSPEDLEQLMRDSGLRNVTVEVVRHLVVATGMKA